jgi:DNA helicase-2/ATP-dependent DNA helicase PcrA
LRREDLLEQQLKVVEATERVVLVLGSAGSGKTTTALWAAREHVDRGGCGPQRTLFVTFSRTAVGQIARRARGVLAGLGSYVEIHTFHSLSYRLLRAFGQFDGYGATIPAVESEAKLLGRDGTRLSYDDLIPAALKLLESRRVRELIAARWGLVVCDEFQDTTADQWNLLQKLAHDSRLLLFADSNQMIYTWIKTVSPQRIDEARLRADREITLEEASHRDPSGVIPAMAAAIRQRNFTHEAISAALDTDRLRVLSCPGCDVPDLAKAEIASARRLGCRSIGVFETTNIAVAELSAELIDIGVNHTLIGIPEAQGEGLVAQAMLYAFGLGTRSFDDARLQLGIFLTAVTRRNEAPRLAIQLRDNSVSSRSLQTLLEELEGALSNTADPDDLLHIVASAWEGLGITSGVSAWQRASRSFTALVRRILTSPHSSPDELANEIINAANELQTEALVTMDAPHTGAVQLMNFHQTKGREADAVILVYREGGWVTSYSDQEPFEEASRVLYVALTRARNRVTVLLPPEPHELVAPLMMSAEA